MGAALAIAVMLGFAPDDVVVPPLLEVAVPPPCSDDSDCPYEDQPYCDGVECVACLDATHCSEGWDCRNGRCDDACRTDRDCEGIDGADRCDPDAGFCVECLATEDCARAEYCADDGSCRDDHCDPGDLWCWGSRIVRCEADGGTTTEVENCEASCDDTGDEPRCVQVATDTGLTSGTTGGSTSGPSTTTSGAPPPSATRTETDGSPPADVVDRGCSCRTPPRSAFLPMLLLLVTARRRRPQVGHRILSPCVTNRGVGRSGV
jgi:MYXO-CTERM domain-containing protein